MKKAQSDTFYARRGGFSPLRGVHIEEGATERSHAHEIHGSTTYEFRGTTKEGAEFGANVEKRRRELRLTHRELTQRMRGWGVKVGDSQTRQYVGPNASRPRDVETLRALAMALETTVEFLLTGVHLPETRVVSPASDLSDPATLGLVLVDELVFTDRGKSQTAETWGLSKDFLDQEARVSDKDNLAIIKVETPTGVLEYGDRILVDRSTVRPSPAGYFLHWDGIAHVVNYIEVRPGANKPTARVSKDPQGTDMYEIPTEKLKIVGRVKARWHAL